MVPRGGCLTPPAKVIEPLVGPINPPKMDKTVDFPALRQDQRQCPLIYDNAYPLGPRRTKIPNFGISRVRSAIAVTSPLFRRKMDVENVFAKLWIEIAISGGNESMSAFFRRQKAQDVLEGSRAS